MGGRRILLLEFLAGSRPSPANVPAPRRRYPPTVRLVVLDNAPVDWSCFRVRHKSVDAPHRRPRQNQGSFPLVDETTQPESYSPSAPFSHSIRKAPCVLLHG